MLVRVTRIDKENDMTNVTKRFLVLDAKNNVMRPKDINVHLPDLKDEGSPSFLKKEAAMSFADILAKRNVGQSFYLVEVLAGTKQYTDAPPSGPWTEATAGEAE